MRNSAHYPYDWDAISREVKEANGYVCQSCGTQCRRPGEPFDTHKRTLTVSHYFQDYESAEILVVCLCSICHLRHDAPFSWWARRRWERHRQHMAGQLAMNLA